MSQVQTDGWTRYGKDRVRSATAEGDRAGCSTSRRAQHLELDDHAEVAFVQALPPLIRRHRTGALVSRAATSTDVPGKGGCSAILTPRARWGRP